MREHARHPRLARQDEWRACGQVANGQVSEQEIKVEESATAGQPVSCQPVPWRLIALALDAPIEDGETMIQLWSNLPAEMAGARIAEMKILKRVSHRP